SVVQKLVVDCVVGNFPVVASGGWHIGTNSASALWYASAYLGRIAYRRPLRGGGRQQLRRTYERNRLRSCGSVVCDRHRARARTGGGGSEGDDNGAVCTRRHSAPRRGAGHRTKGVVAGDGDARQVEDGIAGISERH